MLKLPIWTKVFGFLRKAMAQLFGVDSKTVNEHLQNIFNSLELDKNSTNRKIRIVQTEGKREVSREYLSDFDRAVLELNKK